MNTYDCSHFQKYRLSFRSDTDQHIDPSAVSQHIFNAGIQQQIMTFTWRYYYICMHAADQIHSMYSSDMNRMYGFDNMHQRHYNLLTSSDGRAGLNTVFCQVIFIGVGDIWMCRRVS